MEFKHLVLASSSEYRQSLLRKLHLEFICDSPDIDETPLPDEPPKQTARRLSEAKASELIENFPNSLIIGSDQVPVLKDCRLSKPGNRKNAIEQLLAASDQCVIFYTGVAVANSLTGEVISDIDECHVYFKKLTQTTINRYVDLEKPFNCAGGFKSEGMGIALLNKIEGDDPNALIGLPLIKLIGLLEKFGVKVI
ncbi:MAG: septum formation inhibitor Maf [Gammaproteobacteria bacterium]|jgi:MAF protein|uniref:Maf family protein n=1 Tax=Methylotuvimicrobium sp. TaxID=2822413 RepID=UPI001D657504|nr:septum formation inhibitor Maf [Gammaproteobacteria bacterium]